MDRSSLERWGGLISEKVADFAANPIAQVGLIIFCVAWFYAGLRVDILTAGLSILAITLTQMVLNKQNVREADAHRRDVELHVKVDELVLAAKRARDELAGIEELEEEEIKELRAQAKSESTDAASYGDWKRDNR